MKTFLLQPLEVDGNSLIAIYFPYDKELVKYLKNFRGVWWNPEEKCWHIYHSQKKLSAITEYLQEVAEVDISAFEIPIKRRSNFQSKKKPKALINPLHSHKLTKFAVWLRQKRYSQKTVENYTNMVRVFMHYYNDIPIEEIDLEDIIHFNDDFIVKKGYSVTYQRQMVSALKLFFRQIEHRKIDPEKLERPKKERKIPTVFSKKEVESILQSIRNLKHRAIISFIYSTGLRISELIKLRISDIDSDRLIIHVRQSKGKKDRIVGLSIKIVKILREYYRAYKPKIFLFEGKDGKSYSQSSCRAILKNAMTKSDIIKRGSLHTLRHSFATHLLENGTDIRYIQELLGHKSSRTTEIYTHVSKKHIEDIKSPFDALDLE
jgi:integrase/recombinase XerD